MHLIRILCFLGKILSAHKQSKKLKIMYLEESALTQAEKKRCGESLGAREKQGDFLSNCHPHDNYDLIKKLPKSRPLHSCIGHDLPPLTLP